MPSTGYGCGVSMKCCTGAWFTLVIWHSCLVHLWWIPWLGNWPTQTSAPGFWDATGAVVRHSMVCMGGQLSALLIPAWTQQSCLSPDLTEGPWDLTLALEPARLMWHYFCYKTLPDFLQPRWCIAKNYFRLKGFDLTTVSLKIWHDTTERWPQAR